MGQFLKRLCLFTIAFILIGAVILQFSFQKFRYYQLDEDFAKASWIQKTLFEDHGKSIDILFIGSSLVFTNVDDSILSLKNHNLRILNAAVPGDGRNNQFVVLKEILSKHPVKKVFLELRNQESRAGHQHFGILANGNDLISAPLLMNFNFVKDLKLGIKHRLKGALHKVAGIKLDENKWSVRDFGRHPFYRNPDEEKLERERLYLERLRGRRYLGEKFAEFEHRLSIIYIEKMLDLCLLQNTELAFLYQPVYKETNSQIFAIYKSISHHKPPEALLSDPSLWADPYHLNVDGAAIYTDWLATELGLELQ